MRMRAAALLVCVVSLVLLAVPANAMKIQQVKSPKGIEAWLVEEHSVPIIAMHFAFRGGSSQEPADVTGVANFLSTILDEGAGDMNAAAFHERMEELAFKMRFDAGRDSFQASFETLSMNRDAAFEMLRLALNKPRFDQEAIDRMRAQLLASLAFGERDPGKVASKEWFKLAFDGHPYSRPTEGTKETIARIDRAALESFRKRTFARSNLKISVVGDIDAKTLGGLLDLVFGELPEKADLVPVPQVAPRFEAKSKVIEMAVPQSVAVFGHWGPLRKDPEFITSFALNYIIGGGGFNSRLMEEVREKRGLAYSVASYLSPYEHAGLMLGNVATKNEAIEESLDVIRSVFKRVAEEGPTEKELADAKSYLTGSYALRFDTSGKIASQLLGIQIEELGIDYIDKRNGMIEAITMADIKRLAREQLKPDALIVTVVGQPKSKATAGGAAGGSAPTGGVGAPQPSPAAVKPGRS